MYVYKRISVFNFILVILLIYTYEKGKLEFVIIFYMITTIETLLVFSKKKDMDN